MLSVRVRLLAHYRARKYVKRPILDQCAAFLESCDNLRRFIFILCGSETIKMNVSSSYQA